MGCLLIQLDSRLLWQVLSGAKPELLPVLDQFLAILAGQTKSLPVQAYLAEADWNWLRQTIQAHYEFDLAEEILLRLDVICFGCPEPADFLYAILSDRAVSDTHATVPLTLSLSEFIAIYQAICQLEEIYAHATPDQSSNCGDKVLATDSRSDRFNEFMEEALLSLPALPHVVKRYLQGQPSIGKEQVLWLGLALILALLPYLETIQDWLISPVQAEEPEKPHYLAELIQTATDWLNQFNQQFDRSVAQSNPPIDAPSPAHAIDQFAAVKQTPLVQPLGEVVLKVADQNMLAESNAQTTASPVQPELNAIDPPLNLPDLGLETAPLIEQAVDSADTDLFDSQSTQQFPDRVRQRSSSPRKGPIQAPVHSPVPGHSIPTGPSKGIDDLPPQLPDQPANPPGIADQRPPMHPPANSPTHSTVALTPVTTPLPHRSHDFLLGLAQIDQAGELPRNDELLQPGLDQSEPALRTDRSVISFTTAQTGISSQSSLAAAPPYFFPLDNIAQDNPFEFGAFFG